MRYTDQVSKTVYTDIEIEVQDGVTYFHDWDENDEPRDYYKLNIKKDLRFDTLYDIAITRLEITKIIFLFIGGKLTMILYLGD